MQIYCNIPTSFNPTILFISYDFMSVLLISRVLNGLIVAGEKGRRRGRQL